MKKRIIFVTNSMVLGGIEKSLLDLLYLLPPEQYEISLLLDQKRGEFLPYIPERVKVFQLQYSELDQLELTCGRGKRMKIALKNFQLSYIITTLWNRVKWKLSGKKYSFDYPAFDAILKRTAQIFDEPFDVAVAYFGDMMYQEYAKQITENGELGLAQQLYESMKRNTVTPVQESLQNSGEITETVTDKK